MSNVLSRARSRSGRGHLPGGGTRIVVGTGVAALMVAFGATGALQSAWAQDVTARAQSTGPVPSSPVAGALKARCAATPEADAFLAEVGHLRDSENPDQAKAELAELEPRARQMATDAPADAEAQYRLAAVLGAKLEHESGSAKISGASAVHDQAVKVIELSPQHAGANYIIGKLHASVRRLSGVKRFLATSLLGGGALKNASWEEARARLEVAVREDPCVPEHHFELARVYAEMNEIPAAQRELGYVMELTEGLDGARVAKLRTRSEEFSREWGPGA